MKKLMLLLRLPLALLLLAAAFQIQVPAAQSSECVDGDIKIVSTGPMCSCDGTRTPKDRYECIGGVWEYQSSYCGAPFCRDGGGGGGGGCDCRYDSTGACPAYCYCCY